MEITKIEKIIFPHKTALSEANVKTNRMGVQDVPITKNGILPVTTSFFQKFSLSSRTSHKELI